MTNKIEDIYRREHNLVGRDIVVYMGRSLNLDFQ